MEFKEAVEITTTHITEKWNEICDGLAGEERETAKKYGVQRVYHDLEFRFDGYIAGITWAFKTFLKLDDLETHAFKTALEAHFEAESKSADEKIKRLESELFDESAKDLMELVQNIEPVNHRMSVEGCVEFFGNYVDSEIETTKLITSLNKRKFNIFNFSDKILSDFSPIGKTFMYFIGKEKTEEVFHRIGDINNYLAERYANELTEEELIALRQR